jgi:hypothetical protein
MLSEISLMCPDDVRGNSQPKRIIRIIIRIKQTSIANCSLKLTHQIARVSIYLVLENSSPISF